MFTEDTRTESFLRQMGVKFAYSNDVRPADLTPGWDSRNDGRPVAQREDAILEYASLMESGSPAPAVILHKTDGGLDILDGVQRIAAAVINGYSMLSAYIATCDSADTIAAIRVLANGRLQGHAEPVEWSKRNAVQKLMIDRGMTAADVANKGGWKAAELNRIRDVLEWGFQVRCIGGPQEMYDSILQEVANVTTKDELRVAPKPIASFLSLLQKSRLSSKDSVPYLESFFRPVTKKSRAVEIYSERLEEFKSDPEVEVRLHGRHSPGLSHGTNLRRALKTTLSILNGIVEDGVTLRNVDEFFRLSREVESTLRKLAPNHPKPKMTRTPADRWKR